MFSSVAERVGPVSGKLYHQASAAGEAIRERASAASDAVVRGACAAYRTALEHPRTSIGSAIFAVALIGGTLWYLFGREGSRPVQRRRKIVRVRAGTERRARSHRAARAAAR